MANRIRQACGTETNVHFSLSRRSSVAAKMMVRMGYRQGGGLGREGQGMSSALVVEKTSRRGGKIIHEKDRPAPQQSARDADADVFLAPSAPPPVGAGPDEHLPIPSHATQVRPFILFYFRQSINCAAKAYSSYNRMIFTFSRLNDPTLTVATVLIGVDGMVVGPTVFKRSWRNLRELQWPMKKMCAVVVK